MYLTLEGMNAIVPGKEFMPVSINVYDKLVLLIGGGRIALHKITSLAEYANRIRVIATEIKQEIFDMGIECRIKSYDKEDIKGAFMVYACTNLLDLNRQVYNDCLERGILVNVVDNPALCDFVSPAIYRHDYMSVAVSSNARNVYKSIDLRNRIKDYLENDHLQTP